MVQGWCPDLHRRGHQVPGRLHHPCLQLQHHLDPRSRGQCSQTSLSFRLLLVATCISAFFPLSVLSALARLFVDCNTHIFILSPHTIGINKLCLRETLLTCAARKPLKNMYAADIPQKVILLHKLALFCVSTGSTDHCQTTPNSSDAMTACLLDSVVGLG